MSLSLLLDELCSMDQLTMMLTQNRNERMTQHQVHAMQYWSSTDLVLHLFHTIAQYRGLLHLILGHADSI